MSEKVSFRNKTYHLILIALSTLLVFASLFIFRQIDNNRLTNWNWAFSGVDVSFISLLLLAGIFAAYFISRLSFFEDHPRSSLMILSFLLCLPFWKEPEVVVDASRYFTQAKHLKEYGIPYFFAEWGHDINAWTDLPLLPFVYGLFFKFFGENRVIIQLFNSLLFSTTILFTYLTGKVLWNKTVGYSAGLLLLGMPYLLTQPPLMLVDIATMCFLAFSVYAFITALKKGGAWIVISSIGIFLAVFSKYSTWMLLSVLVVIFVVYLFQNTDHRTQITDGQQAKASGFRMCFQRGLFVAIITLLLAGIVIFLKFDVVSEQIHLLMTYQKPALKGWSENFISTFLYQIHPFITLAAICSVYAAWKKRDMKYVIIFWLVLIIMVLQIKRIRYILPMFPMITLMAAYGFQLIKDEYIRRFAVVSAVIPSLVIALFVYLPFLKQMSSSNLMHAGIYLDSIESSVVEVITLPSDQSSINPSVSVPILDFFTEKNIYYDYHRTSLPDNVSMLPLRFTWTYENPAYYETDSIMGKQEYMPLVVITTGQEGEYPEEIKNKIKHYSKAAEFNTSTGFFRYSPGVIVFMPD
jgi:hypothetical protein